jgi:hypothetical protein
MGASKGSNVALGRTKKPTKSVGFMVVLALYCSTKIGVLVYDERWTLAPVRGGCVPR